MRHRVGHRLLGDRVEGDTVDRLRQRLFRAQQFLHVPADRLALAIGVGREDQSVGALRGVLDFLQPLRLVGIQLPLHRKAVVGIDRAILGRQVADMAIARQNLKIAAEIFLDRLRLCGRFHNNQLHGKIRSPKTLTYVRARVAGVRHSRQGGFRFHVAPAKRARAGGDALFSAARRTFRSAVRWQGSPPSRHPPHNCPASP